MAILITTSLINLVLRHHWRLLPHPYLEMELWLILQAMKTYGLILADIGSNMYISGAPDSRWNNDDLHKLDLIKGSDFEVVNFE